MRILLLAVALLLPAVAHAQRYGDLDARRWGLVYDVPATRQVTVRRAVPYRVRGADTLAIDVYSPPASANGARRPVVVFVNGVGDDLPDRVRNWAIYRDWPRLVAAHGMIGISMDAQRDSVLQSMDALFAFLTGPRARALGIDSTRIGLYAASANVGGTLEYLQGGRAPAAIRAVALYYGQVPRHPLPRVPTLMVVAQGDAPRMRPQLDSLWRAVVDSAAPFTLLFGRGLPHAFDAVTASDDSRRVIQQTVAFWRSHLEPVPGSGAPVEQARRIVEGSYSGDNARLIPLLTEWMTTHPSDTGGLQMLGRALMTSGRSAEAEAALRRAYALDSTSIAAQLGIGQIALGARRWEEAARMLEGVTRRGWETSLIRGQLGFAYLNLQRHADGAREYERAFALGMPPGRAATGVAAYNLASAYARLGRTDSAIALLTRATDNGITNRSTIEIDADFEALRSDQRFQALMARLPQPARTDTLRLEVGSPQVNALLFKPHAARVRVRIGSDTSRVVAEWTNELTLGDSAGRPVMRWVTRGTQNPPSGAPVSWELLQTYDGRTLAPIAYLRTASNGAMSRMVFEENRVTGTRRMPGQTVDQPIDLTLDRRGFIASASDLVPVAVGLTRGAVMTAPMWGPGMAAAETRVFTVVDSVRVMVEGTAHGAWKVEERRHADRVLLATWYLTQGEPYMVYGEVVLPNGQIQYMSEVPVAPSSR